MAKEKSTRKMRVLVIIGAVLLVVVVAVVYQLLFRSNFEVKTNAVTTNTDPVTGSLRKMRKKLKKYPYLYENAFGGRVAELEYGTYVIPGLKSTRTLETNKDRKPSICTSMTPQGLAVTEKYLLVSAYCRTHTHNSVIYVIDKQTHEFIKEIVLKGKPHVGGLAYDTVNKMVWVSSFANGFAQANNFSLEELETYQFSDGYKPMSYTNVYNIYTIARDSFMTYYEEHLYLGYYRNDEMSIMEKFKIEKGGGLKMKDGFDLGLSDQIPSPEDIAIIGGKVQGIAFYKNMMLMSHSYGIEPSTLAFYRNTNSINYFMEQYALQVEKMPQKMEQIYVDGDDLYVLFESAAYAYRGYSFPVIDRILKVSLKSRQVK